MQKSLMRLRPDFQEIFPLGASGSDADPGGEIGERPTCSRRSLRFLPLLKRNQNAFLLESVEGREKVGRYTFLGARPYMTLRAREGRVEVTRGKAKQARAANPLEVLRELLHQHSVAQVPDLPPLRPARSGTLLTILCGSSSPSPVPRATT